MSAIYTGGTFDLFHYGHVNLLRACSRIAGPTGTVTVALNTDDFIEAFKGAAPVMSFDERATILRACRYVNFVIPNTSGSDSRPSIEQVSPNFIVVGSDWATRDYYAQMSFNQQWLDARDIQLIYVPYTANVSTTKLRADYAI